MRRVLADVDARLEMAALFGSRARGDARPDSDVDLLLLFRTLSPDREPHATRAEEIAEGVAAWSGIPVSVWSVSRVDLREGRRTPMLVDALSDALPIWPAGASVPRVSFTPGDAFFCAGCLLERVAEGSGEVADARAAGQGLRASRRAREDVVRLCTALLLLEGRTRPRRAAAVRAVRRLIPSLEDDPVLTWAERSYELSPRDAAPPAWRDVAARIAWLRGRVEGARLATAMPICPAPGTGAFPRMAP